MSSKVGYAKIGAFVLTAIGLAVGAIIVFGAGAAFKDKVMAETYIDESVQGLEIGSPVKSRGVQIGRVEKIDFVYNHYKGNAQDEEAYKHGRQILVRFSLIPEVFYSKSEADMQHMIDDGLRIRLASAGLTGGMYLEVDFVDPKRNPAMKLAWQPANHYIPSAASTGTRLLENAERILAQIESMQLDKVAGEVKGFIETASKLLKDDIKPTIAEIHASIKDVPATVKKLDHTIDAIDAVVAKIGGLVEKDLAPAIANVNAATKELPKTIETVNAAVKEIPAAVAQVNRTLKRVDGLVEGRQDAIEDILENLRLMSTDLRELSGSIKRYPSSAILGGPPPKKEQPK